MISADERRRRLQREAATGDHEASLRLDEEVRRTTGWERWTVLAIEERVAKSRHHLVLKAETGGLQVRAVLVPDCRLYFPDQTAVWRLLKFLDACWIVSIDFEKFPELTRDWRERLLRSHAEAMPESLQMTVGKVVETRECEVDVVMANRHNLVKRREWRRATQPTGPAAAAPG